MTDGALVFAAGTAVSLLTEIAKTLIAKTRLPADTAQALAPYLTLCFSLLAISLWVISQPTLPGRTDIWALFMDWLMILAAAVGVYHGTNLARRARRER